MSSERIKIVDNDRSGVLVDDNGTTKHRVSFEWVCAVYTHGVLSLHMEVGSLS